MRCARCMTGPKGSTGSTRTVGEDEPATDIGRELAHTLRQCSRASRQRTDMLDMQSRERVRVSTFCVMQFVDTSHAATPSVPAMIVSVNLSLSSNDISAATSASDACGFLLAKNTATTNHASETPRP